MHPVPPLDYFLKLIANGVETLSMKANILALIGSAALITQDSQANGQNRCWASIPPWPLQNTSTERCRLYDVKKQFIPAKIHLQESLASPDVPLCTHVPIAICLKGWILLHLVLQLRSGANFGSSRAVRTYRP